jgi:hypothetical protein
MGRYWNTDTGREGKFCFGKQSTNSPEQFGMYENNTTITYYIDEEEFDTGKLNRLLNRAGYNKTLSELSIKELESIQLNLKYEDQIDCDIDLGIDIYLDCKTEGYCRLEAEL